MQHEQTVLTVAPATDHFAKFIFLRATSKHKPSGWGPFLFSVFESKENHD
jgi:hypothetical protein